MGRIPQSIGTFSMEGQRRTLFALVSDSVNVSPVWAGELQTHPEWSRSAANVHPFSRILRRKEQMEVEHARVFASLEGCEVGSSRVCRRFVVREPPPAPPEL